MENAITKLVRKHRELLLLEREENLEHFFKDLSPANLRLLERNGQALTKLVVNNVADKGTGRFQIEFAKPDDAIFDNDFSSGDIVLCLRHSQKKNQPLRGIISEASDTLLSIATSEALEDLQEDEVFSVIKTDSDVTYKCQTR